MERREELIKDMERANEMTQREREQTQRQKDEQKEQLGAQVTACSLQYLWPFNICVFRGDRRLKRRDMCIIKI